MAENDVIEDRKKFYNEKHGSEINGCELKKSSIQSDFEKMILHFSPELIAVSCLSVDFSFAINFLRPFKQKYHIPIIFGGIHAILMPDGVLNSGISDFVCIGEGENSFPDLLAVLDKGESPKQ